MSYLVKRLIYGLVVVFCALTLAFLLAYVIGDPVLMYVGADASAEIVARYREALGFDRPIYVQYLDFMGGVLQGDLGQSYRQRSPVMPILIERLGYSAELAVPAILLAMLVSIPVGVISAVRRNSLVDYTARTGALLGQAAPNFWVGHPAVGIVANRVARARAVFERLREELNDFAKIILLIGPARAVDRDDLTRELQPIRTGQDDIRRQMQKPLVVVATQTVEAGVDIDFDGLVTEAAALDALKQRFGRLNRAGRDIKPEAVILAHKDDIGSKADDPVYGDRIRLTWEKLRQLAPGANDAVDFGIEALREQIDEGEAAKLGAPTKDAPVLMPAYADLWSQTSPIPNADPEVALFLHGPDHAGATVQILWRADIDERNDLQPAMGESTRAKVERARVVELFELVHPRAAEAIEVPLWAARAWLSRPDSGHADFSDVAEREQEAVDERRAGRRVFRWAGEDSERTRVVYASALRPGDLVVVPADYGGCDQWGWNPKSSKPVIDVAETAAWPYRGRRFFVRVTPELAAQSVAQELRRGGEVNPSVDRDAFAAELATLLEEHEGDSAGVLLDAVLRWCERKHRANNQSSDEPENLNNLRAIWLPERLKELRNRCVGALRSLPYRVDDESHAHGVVFFAPRGLALERDAAQLAALPATESEELSISSDKPVPLQAHCDEVRVWAEGFAKNGGLRSDVRAAVALAAYLHDSGKADSRFQDFLAGGDPYGSPATDPLAKSGQKRLPRGAWERAGLPLGWRHEALSVRLAMRHADVAQAHDRELVLWLIGTHHGYGRPLFPHADPGDAEARCFELPDALGDTLPLAAGAGPQSLAFEFNGRDWVQLFETLKRRYGIWGLARLEAFLRLADHRASEAIDPPQRFDAPREAAE